MEKAAKLVEGVFRCPVCDGPLNAIVGLSGREVCRKCLIPIVTGRDKPGFDPCEWGYLGQDAGGNALYGRLGLEVKDTSKEPVEYEAKVEGGKITEAKLLPDWKDIKRKTYGCDTSLMEMKITVHLEGLPDKEITVTKKFPKVDRKMTEAELDIFMDDMMDVASEVGRAVGTQMQGLLIKKKLI